MKKGFTLVELLVVVAILGVLAAVGIVAYSGYMNKSKINVFKSNEKTIVDLFGPEFDNTLSKVKSGEADASELDQIIEDKIEFDFENRRIVFKHENNKRYPLFTMGGRAKGLGGSPAMEIAQTPLMAYALKAGTFDSTKWPPEMQEKFKKQIGEIE